MLLCVTVFLLLCVLQVSLFSEYASVGGAFHVSFHARTGTARRALTNELDREALSQAEPTRPESSSAGVAVSCLSPQLWLAMRWLH